MSRVSSISRSGVNAAARRLGVAATNIANVQTPSFVPRRVEQVDASDGTAAAILAPIISQASTIVAGQADAPATVDLAHELTQMLLAQAAFKANMRVLGASGTMQKSTLDLLT